MWYIKVHDKQKYCLYMLTYILGYDLQTEQCSVGTAFCKIWLNKINKYLVLFAFSYFTFEPFPKIIKAEPVQLQQQFTTQNLLV